MITTQEYTVQISDTLAGLRLDVALAKLFPEYSRAKLQHFIRTEKVTVDGHIKRARDKVISGETIVLKAELEPVVHWESEALPFPVVYEDEDLLVINKAAGIAVHPGAGRKTGTLVNALLHYYPLLAQLPRAGLVHRLDKDTSGLLVVAKTLFAYTHLVKMIQAHAVQREYLALVEGTLIAGGSVEQPIGRHPKLRTRMAVVASGKNALTHYRVLERFRAHTLLKVLLETGRTHQIRVHLSWMHHPLLGDSLYGWRLRLPPKASTALIDALRGFKRQALHAARLSLQHPRTGEWKTWEAPLPEDMQNLLRLLQHD